MGTAGTGVGLVAVWKLRSSGHVFTMVNTAERAQEYCRSEETEDRRHFDSEPSWPYHLPCIFMYIYTFGIYTVATHNHELVI